MYDCHVIFELNNESQLLLSVSGVLGVYPLESARIVAEEKTAHVN